MFSITRSRGLAIVLSSPSGAGKSTIFKALLRLDSEIIPSISITTRLPRPNEVNLKDYIFLSQESFEEKLDKGEVLEFAKIFGHYYGTLKQNVINNIIEGKDVLFDIDWQGAKSIKDNLPNDLVSIYLLPPSIEELQNRLINRNQDSMDSIKNRVEEAKYNITHCHKYDYIVINDNLDSAINQIFQIIKVERMKTNRVQIKTLINK